MFLYLRKIFVNFILLLAVTNFSKVHASAYDIIVEGTGKWAVKNATALWCNTTVPLDSGVGSSSSASNPYFVGFVSGTIGLGVGLTKDYLLIPVGKKLLSFCQPCTKQIQKCFRKRCRCCNQSSLDMLFSDVFPLNNTSADDYGKTLYDLDQSLTESGWVKSPVSKETHRYGQLLVGYRYTKDGSWISLIRDYTDDEQEAYVLNKRLRYKAVSDGHVRDFAKLIGTKAVGESNFYFKLKSNRAKKVSMLADQRDSDINAEDSLKRFTDRLGNESLFPLNVQRHLNSLLGLCKQEGGKLRINSIYRDAYLVVHEPVFNYPGFVLCVHNASEDNAVRPVSSPSNASEKSEKKIKHSVSDGDSLNIGRVDDDE